MQYTFRAGRQIMLHLESFFHVRGYTKICSQTKSNNSNDKNDYDDDADDAGMSSVN